MVESHVGVSAPAGTEWRRLVSPWAGASGCALAALGAWARRAGVSAGIHHPLHQPRSPQPGGGRVRPPGRRERAPRAPSKDRKRLGEPRGAAAAAGAVP